MALGGSLPRDAPRHFDYGAPNDRLDAAERALEWGAALLKARASVHSHGLRRLLSGAGPPVAAGNSGEQASDASVSPEQESLFEHLRVAVGGVTTAWDCTVEGAGSRMRVRLAEPVTKQVVWSRSGSRAQVLAAFSDWLSLRG